MIEQIYIKQLVLQQSYEKSRQRNVVSLPCFKLRPSRLATQAWMRYPSTTYIDVLNV